MTNAPDQDARQAPRRGAAQIPDITGIRVSPQGVTATLINISANGALIETSARVQPGAALTLHFDGSLELTPVDSRVARSVIVAVGAGGTLRYQVGVAFMRTIDLPPLLREHGVVLQEPAPAAAETIGAGNRW